jgi:hypothetical protein
MSLPAGRSSLARSRVRGQVGFPQRGERSGVGNEVALELVAHALAFGGEHMLSGVSTTPGAMALTRIPR